VLCISPIEYLGVIQELYASIREIYVSGAPTPTTIVYHFFSLSTEPISAPQFPGATVYPRDIVEALATAVITPNLDPNFVFGDDFLSDLLAERLEATGVLIDWLQGQEPADTRAWLLPFADREPGAILGSQLSATLSSWPAWPPNLVRLRAIWDWSGPFYGE
jgi:hypothetical protein